MRGSFDEHFFKNKSEIQFDFKEKRPRLCFQSINQILWTTGWASLASGPFPRVVQVFLSVSLQRGSNPLVS